MIDKKYDHNLTEKNKQEKWRSSNYYKPSGKGTNFSIVLPPPNVTGKLHLGHAWNTTLQDIIARYKKIQGFNVHFLPGMDHAGIATQVKFEQYLKDKNITKFDLGRKKFVSELSKWAEDRKKEMRKQWDALGLSLDLSKEKFTLSKESSQVVNKVFVDLYKNKLIYQDFKLVNWDFKLKTAISNIEVVYKKKINKLYYIKYFLVDSPDTYLVVATSRPETMFGDQTIFVNPTDKRYKKYHGKKVINPANNKEMTIMSDSYVDKKFGTGVLKCTPAHDHNDYELAKKYKLELISVIDESGYMNENSGIYKGMERFECKKKLIEYFNENNYIEKIEEYETQISYSERTDTVVEPILSLQWFVKMKDLAKKVIKIQSKNTNQKTDFYPARFNKTLSQWLNNIEDWCISRQLWWGHRIPVWVHKKTGKTHVDINPPKDPRNWKQDESVLDTWFSSSLWPLICTDWDKNPLLFNKIFPTNVMVTGYDIIFFWVSRMMMMSVYFTGKVPFKNVLIHGLIRDKDGKKMSKSLGNGVDPSDVVNEFGVDSLRLFLISSSTAGEDLRFSKDKVRANWNFINKLWNSARFFMMNNNLDKNWKMNKQKLRDKSRWILNKLNRTIIDFKKKMDNYQFILASKILYDFVWDDFCNTYIELSKVDLLNKEKKPQVLYITNYVLKNICILLHPFIPFVTEEIYKNLNGAKKNIVQEKWPNLSDTNADKFTDKFIKVIEAIRKVRWDRDIPNSKKLTINLLMSKPEQSITDNLAEINEMLSITNAEITNISPVSLQVQKISIPVSKMVLEIETEGLIDYSNELKKLESRKLKIERELSRSNSILSNENFISKASKAKVDHEKQEKIKFEQEYKMVKEAIKELKKKI